jgi:hypothetical protein
MNQTPPRVTANAPPKAALPRADVSINPIEVLVVTVNQALHSIDGMRLTPRRGHGRETPVAAAVAFAPKNPKIAVSSA